MRMKKLITLLLVLLSVQAFSQSTTLVISQVYGGGGNSGAPYTADFLELHNISGTAQSTAGLSVQYASSTATGAWSGVFALPTATIPPGGFYLIRMSAAGATGAALPTPDAAPAVGSEIAMSATNGRVALVNGTTALTACPTAGVIDLVGFGTSVCFEGTATPALSNTTGAVRNNNGCAETNNNLNDFTVGTLSPRNSASAPILCGAASPTLSATALTAFGNVCVNATAGPNSFTITGTALTATNVTVGALAGFSYATTAGGTYTGSLSLAQPGGAYTQQIFVRFVPTAVQSYNGNIPVGGGGAATINVAATGTGINNLATVSTGASSGVTQTAATLAGNAVSGCSAITAYGIEYSTTINFVNGTGTQAAASNINGSGDFSTGLAGLAPGTTYYYKAYATNGGGTAYGTQQSFTTVASTPVLSANTLAAFGNVCTNTTAGPNSFTVSGSNLTTAGISVGPLAGYEFATASGGPYTASLALAQPGGTYTQQVFVRFLPTAVQSYNGVIPVSGGGAPATNVAAAGAGVNTAPTVVSGTASGITQTTALVGGNITATGCTAVTAYGIEYSTVNGFANGSGTAVAGSNVSGGNFSVPFAGLTVATTYYYKAYATNGGGTVYGAQGSFTTAAPVLAVTALTAFGNTCVNATAGPNSFTVSSNAVTTANINVGPLNGYTFATTATGTYAPSLSLSQPGGAYSQQIFVRFTPTLVQAYNGNIPVSGGGVTALVNVAASGNGVNTAPTATTGSATVNSPTAVVLTGLLNSSGCSAVTSYGIEYTGISGLANGLGTKLPSNNLNGGNFSVNLNGLVPGGKYYYKAYAANSGGMVYGAEQSFTMKELPGGFVIYGIPVKRGGNVHYSYKGITPDHYQIQVFNSNGQLVFEKGLITPVDFIDDNFTLPGQLGPGRYSLHIVGLRFRDEKPFMVY
jgi:hypothetical protein